VTWVLTTTDKAALEAAVGAEGVVEIIFGEPYGVADDGGAEAIPRRTGCAVMGNDSAPNATVPGSVHVLVVDDSRDILDVLVQLLQLAGARVTAASSAAEALAILARERPDILLSDLTMPGHDGLWLIEQVRRLPPGEGGATPAACLTGLVEAEHRARVLRAGYQFHVPKPVQPERLLGILTLLALKP
jgi:CheY-like chemotaxis protein